MSVESDLTMVEKTAEQFLRFPFFSRIFQRERFFFFPLCQVRPQTKCGILEQIHACVAFVCFVVNSQQFRARGKNSVQNNAGVLY